MALSPIQREVLVKAINASLPRDRADFVAIDATERTIRVLVRKGMAGFEPGQIVVNWWDAVVTDEGYRAVGRQPPASDATARRTRGNG